jgi:hypothetical protein
MFYCPIKLNLNFPLNCGLNIFEFHICIMQEL